MATEIVVKSDDSESIIPLISSAIENEANLINLAIKKSKKSLKSFEEKNKITTGEMINKLISEENITVPDAAEWLDELNNLIKMLKEYRKLKDIKVSTL